MCHSCLPLLATLLVMACALSFHDPGDKHHAGEPGSYMSATNRMGKTGKGPSYTFGGRYKQEEEVSHPQLTKRDSNLAWQAFAESLWTA